jgi:serpin B
MIRALTLVAVLALALDGTCGSAAPPPPAGDFTFDLYRRAAEKEGNVVLSPYSVAAALAMVREGARGATADEMARVLGAAPPAVDAVGSRLDVANSVWLQSGFAVKPDYTSLLQSRYGAVAEQVDFQRATEQARQRINTWVEQKTEGKIEDLLVPGTVTADTRLVLANAVYFKGAWESPFDAKRTAAADFTLASGEKVSAPFMNQKARFGYVSDDRVTALSMPYAGGDVSMVVLLPAEAGGLVALERDLTRERLDAWVGAMRRLEVTTAIPKFQMTSEMSLADTLSAMGMRRVFTRDADLSGIAEGKGLALTAVVHKAFVDVNEEGTEAAAATGGVVGVTSVQNPVVFRADRPFLFVVRHEPTGTVLFIGRVVDPR